MKSTPTISIAIAALTVLLVAAPKTHAQAPAAKTTLPPSYTVISPIFGQLVRFSMPSTFAPASFEKTNGPSYIREAVLKGETVSAWTQMITVTGAKGIASNPQVTPEELCGLDGCRVQEGLSRHLRGKTVRGRQIRQSGRFCRGGGCGGIRTARTSMARPR